ncbi:MAG: dehydrogenase E1 component subunit alpha/beta [Nitrososphaerota archaeon]|nr:dehydrogenase E1 component subunit alpha/beta [Nitrososphaerota archaeon]
MPTETNEELIYYLRKMLEIRYFEEKVMDLLSRDIVKGASHLYVGEEAVAVGAIAAIRKDDYITSTHRGHGHCIAKGGDLKLMLAELCGKVTGYCKGRGGSMHIADVSAGNLGATGIVGSNIPVATGAGLSIKLRGTDQVVLCFFGDGAANTGAFHESVNMAAIWDLPVIYICENNLYGMSVAVSRAFPFEDIAERAKGYNIPGLIADGMDVLDVKKVVGKAVERARKGEGPSLVECKTYRFYGHSRSDARVYRTREEEKMWKMRDPILNYEKRLIEWGVMTEEEIKKLEDEVIKEVEEAEKFALSSPYPPIETLYDGLYTDLYVDPSSSIRDLATAKKMGLKMRRIRYVQALNEALREEMRRDSRVFLMGEDIALYGGAYSVTKGLHEEFGLERVRDTPISEAAIAGAAAGAAMTGMRPVAEIMYIDFSTLAMDQIVNIAAKNRYMFGGKSIVPVVYRTQGGAGRGIAEHHSQSLEAWYMHVPGIFVVMPSTPFDAKGLLKTCIRDDNPVMFIEHKMLYGLEGEVPEVEYTVPLGVADIKREGTDVTIIAYSRMVHFALEAAEELAKEGISAEVVDPRTLKPLDIDTIINSVKKTNRAVVVYEGYRTCGVGAEITALIMEKAFDYLDAPVLRVAGEDVPIPMSPVLEDAAIPSKQKIIDAVKKIV